METHALIPFVAVLVSAAFGAVSIAWSSDRRASHSMGALFLCTGVWALTDLMLYVEVDPDRALMWARGAHIAPLLLGPSVLWVVTQMLPQAPARFTRHAGWGAVALLPLGIGAAFVPGSVTGVVETGFGSWMPVYGPVSIALIPVGFLFPIYAAVVAMHLKKQGFEEANDVRRAWALHVCVAASILAAVPTEYIFPLMGIPVPKLGALVVTLSSVLAWLHVLHQSDDLAMTPHGVARGVLGKLRDGVALVRLDGTILSTNTRFSEMTGRSAADLLGASLDDLIDTPISRVCSGLQDRKSLLRSVSGETVPVALSSSIARNRRDVEIGVVIVFRDLRALDALRKQLLNSGRLAAIGELAAGIAHEVNNPLAFIRSDLNLLTERMAEIRSHLRNRDRFDHEVLLFDRSARRVEMSMAGIERVAEIVGDVREFAHLGGISQGGCDPEGVVDGAMRLARLQRGAEVELRIASVACGDRFDSGQELKQVLLALFRALLEGVEVAGQIEADLRTNGEDFTIGLSAGRLAESASEMADRFEVFSGRMREDAEAEFGLEVAAVILGRLGGRVNAEAVADDLIRIELSVPLEAQGAA